MLGKHCTTKPHPQPLPLLLSESLLCPGDRLHLAPTLAVPSTWACPCTDADVCRLWAPLHLPLPSGYHCQTLSWSVPPLPIICHSLCQLGNCLHYFLPREMLYWWSNHGQSICHRGSHSHSQIGVCTGGKQDEIRPTQNSSSPHLPPAQPQLWFEYELSSMGSVLNAWSKASGAISF